MRNERVVFGFFILLALTLNVSFVYGDLDSPAYHNKFELFAAFLVSLACTVLKLGDRSDLGALMLATSLVADVQLLCAIAVWTFNVGMLDSETMAMIVSFAVGALVANVVSVILMTIEAATLRR